MNHHLRQRICFKFLMLSCFFCFSQSEPLDADRGQSYDSESISNESVIIPLYTVNIDGASVPINLSYNTSGAKVTEVPSNVGFGWSLRAGGSIEKKRRHLIDESPTGWFFTDEFEDIEAGSFVESSTNWSGPNYYNSTVRMYDRIDSSPDMFMVRMSDGFSMDYIYNRSNNMVTNDDIVVFKQSHDAHVFTNFYRLGTYSYNEDYEDGYYENDDKYDVMIREASGVNYLFRKGAKRERPWDLENRLRTEVDSTYFDNYYVHKIGTTFNEQSISFEYVETDIIKLIAHAGGTRVQTNSDEMTPPSPQDPFETGNYRSDISIQDVKRKDIKRIVTDKEIVEFLYKEDYYHNNLGDIQSPSSQFMLDKVEHQKIRLIDEIKVFDHNGNYITGYKFNYTGQTENQSDYEGDLKIKSIIKYGKNRKSSFVYKEFEYGYHNRPSANTVAQDVFGYYNGQHDNDPDNRTPLYLFGQGVSNMMPSETHLISGMLKAVTNQNGGKTELEYQENTYGDMYYGGLLIKSISNLDVDETLLSKVEYEYDEPEGFGLPVYNFEVDQGNGPPNAYEEGYYEPQQQIYGWQTYYTKEDNIDAQWVHYYKVNGAPFDLMKNTPTLDAYVDEMSMEYQEFYHNGLSQIEHGIIYKKVTEKQINVINNLPQKGKVVKYYEPVINGYNLGRLVKRVETYNRNEVKISESQYNYDKAYLGYISAFDIDNSLHTESNRRYYVDYAFIFRVKNVLRDITKFNFDYESGDFQNEFKETFIYLDESNPDLSTNYKRVKNSEQFFNGQIFSKTENVYMSEFGFFDSLYDQNLQNLHYINPLIEENKWNWSNNQWLLESSVARSYLYNGSVNTVTLIQKNQDNGQFYNESNFTHAYFDQEGNLISQEGDTVEFDYLDDGRIKAKKDVGKGITTIYQRSNEYEGLYVDATLTTDLPYDSQANYFIKMSFENRENSNHIKFSRAFSGNYVFNGNSINLGNYPNDYVISFWSFENNHWVYNKMVHTGGDAIITKPSGAQYLDEVIIRPKYGALSSVTIKPLIGKTSLLNRRGEGSRIEYDLYGVPLFSYDKNGNVTAEKRSNNININN